MDERLTLVELGKRLDNRQTLVFGKPFEIVPCPHDSKLAVFMPGQIFGYERWRGNDYSTISWQFYVARTTVNAQTNAIPGVYPGADILFQSRGKDATRRAIRWVKSCTRQQGFTLEETPEYVWRQVANRRLLRGKFPTPDAILYGVPHA